MLDVCVDYVGRDGTVDMDEIAGRFATQASLPLVFDSTEPPVVEAGLQHHGGKAILNSANLEEGEARGQAHGPRVQPRARVRRGGDLPHHRRGGPGPHRRLEAARRASASTTSRSSGTASSPPTSSSTRSRSRSPPATTTCAATRWRRSRRSAASRPSCPARRRSSACRTCRFGLKPAARHVLNSVFLHECREAGLDAAIVHAARIMPLHRIDERQREVALDLIYDRRRDDYDPLTEFMALFEGVEAGAIEKEDRSGWPVEERLQAPHHRRRPRRPRSRPRRAARRR